MSWCVQKSFVCPVKKHFQASDIVFQVVLVDVSEQPIERPLLPWRAVSRKIAKNGITAAKRSVTLKKRR